MGVVYHAIDPNIGRPVAIKTIALSNTRKPEEQERMRERLFREARSAGILSHPGIVTIYDVEQQGDLAYIAMEYVDGPTLDQMLSESHSLTPEQIFSILGQTAVALDYAHQKGIVHRDIKPANVMIAADGTAKITDFGIAKITAAEQFTMTGSIVGTPHYMSPEQVQGLTVDGRSDQFSLAVIAFEMLTGEKPYTGEHLTTVVYKIVAEEPAVPHRINPTLTRDIESAIQKGLSKKPDDRFRNCQEFVSTLEKACAASKGWKPMPRGGSLMEPTLAEGARPPVSLPPGRKPLRSARAGETTIGEERAEKKGGFLTFLLAMLVAAGLLALIGWQALPWLSKKGPEAGSQTAQGPGAGGQGPGAAQGPAGGGQGAVSAVSQEQKPSPMLPAEPAKAESAPADSKTAASSQAPPPTEAAKPVETPPASTQEAAKAVVPVPAPRREAADVPVRPRPSNPPQPQFEPVSIISSPGGATATMDGRSEQTCTTPCTLNATPGNHEVLFNLPGYGIEHRDIFVGTYPLEMQAVVLHPIGGTLLLTSEPPGARVLVDGKPTGLATPAELRLRPGSYRVTIEKDGRQVTQTVEVRTGISYLKLLLGP